MKSVVPDSLSPRLFSSHKKVISSTLLMLGFVVFETAASNPSMLHAGKTGASIKAAHKSHSAMQRLEQHLQALPDCNQKSRFLEADGDSYYDFGNNKAANSQQNSPGKPRATDTIEELFSQLHGKWQGHAVETVCYQSGNSRLHVFNVDRLVIEQLPPARTTVNLATITNDKRRVASNNPRHASGEIRTVSVTEFPQATDFQAIERSETERGTERFHLRSRYRERTTNAGNTVIREREDWLEPAGNTLAWRTDWYTNGHYSGTEFSLLRR